MVSAIIKVNEMSCNGTKKLQKQSEGGTGKGYTKK
jgi:hypothetical protein